MQSRSLAILKPSGKAVDSHHSGARQETCKPQLIMKIKQHNSVSLYARSDLAWNTNQSLIRPKSESRQFKLFSSEIYEVNMRLAIKLEL